MNTVVGVKFMRAGKMYYFHPDGKPVKVGDHVIVETARGVEYGEIVMGPNEIEDDEQYAPLKKVIRIANKHDRETLENNKKKERDARDTALQKIEAHKLEMKLVDVEYTFDGNKIIFYFTADGRIDFRELVKDLASVFKTRIELKQIGVRDKAKMLGGLAACGRPVCCGSFLGEFQPVSIKMAKEQNLSLSPTKISGICGRLMCCLKYEQDYYEEMRSKMPRVNKEVTTPDGQGIVIENNVITETSRVKVTLKDGTVEIREYPRKQLQFGQANKVDDKHDDADNDMVLDDEIKSLLD